MKKQLKEAQEGGLTCTIAVLQGKRAQWAPARGFPAPAGSFGAGGRGRPAAGGPGTAGREKGLLLHAKQMPAVLTAR
jgi:hypothetical protein